jgi:lipoate-protein ligase A
MAVDEALLDMPQSGWTLRFYQWDRPTVSIGYAQPLARAVDRSRAHILAIPVVRRPTGGRAVLHGDEITYSIAGPLEVGALAGGVSASYRRIAAGLRAGLRSLGVVVDVERRGPAPSPSHKGPCFSARTRHELAAAGRKLVGSAQRRRGGRLLQHGSLLLGAPDERLWAVLGAGFREAMGGSVGLDEVLSPRPARRRLVACLTDGLAAELALSPRRSVLTVGERRVAAGLCARYRDAEWTARR